MKITNGGLFKLVLRLGALLFAMTALIKVPPSSGQYNIFCYGWVVFSLLAIGEMDSAGLNQPVRPGRAKGLRVRLTAAGQFFQLLSLVLGGFYIVSQWVG
jgi:hypothetical protein